MLHIFPHDHYWDYIRYSQYDKKELVDTFLKKCSICDYTVQVDEEEYLENAYLHIDDLYFSYN
jgi:hypothetical protein